MAERRGDPPPPGTLSRQVTLAVLTLAGLIVQRLALPWGLVSVVFLLPAAVLGVRLIASLLRARIGGFTMLGSALTLAIVVFSLFGSLITAVFYPTAVAFQRCQQEAITEAAVKDCRDDLNARTQNLFGLVPGS